MRNLSFITKQGTPMFAFLLSLGSASEAIAQHYPSPSPLSLAQGVDAAIHPPQKKVLRPIPEPDPSGFFIPTLNQTGYMTTQLDPYSADFVAFASKAPGTVLEIGAAYGIAALAALEKGATIIANDLSEEHLLHLQETALSKKLNISKLSLMPGDVRSDLSFPSNTLDAILICRVLHFFTGAEIEAFLTKAYGWLKPDGKLFIVAETPYISFLENFLPDYEENVKRKLKWPGYVPDLKKYIQDPNLPKTVHSMDIPILRDALLEKGFIVEKIGYIDRSDFPPDRRVDGRESVGVIASKPIQ